MDEIDLSEVKVGDLIYAVYDRNNIECLVLVDGVGERAISGCVINGQYPVMFEVATGEEAVERRDVSDFPSDVNPFYPAFLSGKWAEGLHVRSTAALPDDLIVKIKALADEMGESGLTRCEDLYREHGDVVTEAFAIFQAELAAAAAPGMR